MSVLLTVSIKTLKQNWSVTMQMEKEWSEWCRLWNETRQPLRQKWSNTLNNSSAVADKLFECVWLFLRVGTYRANIQAILPWNFAKLPKWRLCFIVTRNANVHIYEKFYGYMKRFRFIWKHKSGDQIYSVWTQKQSRCIIYYAYYKFKITKYR